MLYLYNDNIMLNLYEYNLISIILKNFRIYIFNYYLEILHVYTSILYNIYSDGNEIIYVFIYNIFIQIFIYGIIPK